MIAWYSSWDEEMFQLESSNQVNLNACETYGARMFWKDSAPNFIGAAWLGHQMYFTLKVPGMWVSHDYNYLGDSSI